MFRRKKKNEQNFENPDYKRLYDILSGKYNHLEQILFEKDRIIERTHTEVSTNITKDLFNKVFNIFDDFEKLHDNVDKGIDISILKEAIELIHKNIINMLSNEMIGVIDSTPGRPFNPEIHEALAAVESDKYDEGYIVEQIRTGYTLEGELLRAARVVVSKGNPS